MIKFLQFYNLSIFEGRRAGSLVISTTSAPCPGSFSNSKGGDVTKIRSLVKQGTMIPVCERIYQTLINNKCYKLIIFIIMKKIGKLKLNQLSKADFMKRQMSAFCGGGSPGCCQCGCGGPSGICENWSANNLEGYNQSLGGGEICSCDGEDCDGMDVNG